MRRHVSATREGVLGDLPLPRIESLKVLRNASALNASALPDARSRRGVNGGGEFCARPVKPFGRGRPWLRWTRALCKFNCAKGAVLSRAETVLQGTTHDTVRAEIGYGEKVSRRVWSKKLEEGIGLTASHKDTEHPEGRRVFELESSLMPQR